jgi:hypothetical protein
MDLRSATGRGVRPSEAAAAGDPGSTAASAARQAARLIMCESFQRLRFGAVTVIKKGIAKVTADPGISEKDKKELLKEFEKLLVAVQPIQYLSNIELVRKYYDKIDTALQ